MRWTFFICFSFIFLHFLSPIRSLPLAPALYVFGDSLFENGNNNWLPTVARANYLPYGVDFAEGSTGRFTNGRIVPDFIAEYLGLPYSPPYLSFGLKTSFTGFNYASSACGILPETGRTLGKCLNLEEQIDLFQRTVENDLPQNLRDSTQLIEHLSKSIYVFSIGSNDYLNNYLLNKSSHTSTRLPQPSTQLLIGKLSQQLERLYNLGARKIIMFELGPLGCVPFVSETQKHTGDCMEETNQMVSSFNVRLSAMLNNLASRLSGSTFVLGRVKWLVDAIKNPSHYGLGNGNNPCCTTWENGTSACIPLSKPCLNPNKHFFWDGFHLTEAVYSVIASRCFKDASVCTPLNIQELLKV